MARKLNLEAEMKRHNISRMDLAEALDISLVSVQKKITGLVEFKCDEMFKAKKCIGTDVTLDELFS
mgnify:FL=1